MLLPSSIKVLIRCSFQVRIHDLCLIFCLFVILYSWVLILIIIIITTIVVCQLCCHLYHHIILWMFQNHLHLHHKLLQNENSNTVISLLHWAYLGSERYTYTIHLCNVHKQKKMMLFSSWYYIRFSMLQVLL